MHTSKTHVLVVGGGFGGVKLALELARSEHFTITLLSDRDTFHYYPTLYHTATGGPREQSTIPLTYLFEGKSVTLAIGTAEKLNRKKKTLATNDGQAFHYDRLVLALGSVPNYFGIKGIEEYSFSITTPDNARKFKNHLHKQLEDSHSPDLNYVIVGGGPTGIELAGALGGYLKEIMEAHGVRHRKVHIDLVEAAPTLVPRMPKRMSKAIARRLKQLGVRLYLNSVVQGETADTLTVNGKNIQSHTVVWTAGVTNSPFFKKNDFTLNERGKVIVNDYLEAEENIYVIGDNAATQFSGMAQTALHNATFLADNLEKQATGRLMARYTPKEPIYVIPAGDRWAAVLWGKKQIYGLAGWVLRLLADLVGFKDYAPWWKAGKQWLTEFDSEEDCPTCKESLLNS